MLDKAQSDGLQYHCQQLGARSATSEKSSMKAANDRTDYHRIAGLALAPVLSRLGYTTEVEVDVSFQRQLIDIIAVQRVQQVAQTLPPIYWQVFDELNEHNLISFKSYSESFNGQALEEFYGHLTNYCKVRAIQRRVVNLYVITNHYPRELLDPLLARGIVTEIRIGEVYDLTISTMKRVRFIVCSRTDNPILALFSADVSRIQNAYRMLRTESDLFAEVSIYWQAIAAQIEKEIRNMYTKEDFLRDYPPRDDVPVLFGWQLEELRRQLAQAAQRQFEQGIEQGIEQGAVAMYHTLQAILNHRLGELPSSIDERLRACTLTQLNTLVNPALDAATWEEFTAHLPSQPA